MNTWRSVFTVRENFQGLYNSFSPGAKKVFFTWFDRGFPPIEDFESAIVENYLNEGTPQANFENFVRNFDSLDFPVSRGVRQEILAKMKAFYDTISPEPYRGV